MAAHGKSINVFLMDGTASGRVKCTLANWTGVAYRIPRVDLDLCKERDDLKESELEEFIDYAKILMGVLGHKVFEPLVSEKPAGEVPSGYTTFYIKHAKRGADARAVQTAEGFAVLAGSVLCRGGFRGLPGEGWALEERAAEGSGPYR